MYCRFCGAKLPEDAAFCVKCGRNLSLTEAALQMTSMNGVLPSEKGPSAPILVEPIKTQAPDAQNAVSEDGTKADATAPDIATTIRMPEVTLAESNKHDPSDGDSPSETVNNEKSTEAVNPNGKDRKTGKRVWIAVILTVVVALVALVAVNYVASKQQNQSYSGSDPASVSNAKTDGLCSKMATAQGEIADGDCTADGKGTIAPSKGLLNLYDALKGSRTSDEQVIVSGSYTKYKDKQRPNLMVTSAMDNLGSGEDASAASKLASLLGESDASTFYTNLMPSDTSSIYVADSSDYKKVNSIAASFPWYRTRIAKYGSFVYQIGFLIQGDKPDRIFIGVEIYDASSIPDSITVQDSKPTTKESSKYSGQSNSSSTQEKQSSNTDFNDLWNSVVEGRDMTKLTGTYCRNDGNCVSLNANPNYSPSSYGESFPGVLSFVSGSSNPLPNGDAQSDLGFQYQSDPGLPSTKMPIDMMAGCQASAGCPEGSTVWVYYVMSGTGLEFFNGASVGVDSTNPPDSSRDFLIIGLSSGGVVSDDSVYYRKG